MNKKPRILVLTLSFGAGHVSAAQNIIGEFQKQIPEAELCLIDVLDECSFLFRVFYVWTYWAMIRYAPRLWGKFFDSRIERRDEQTAPVWMWKKGCRKVFDEIRRFRPDLIVAAEVGASEIAVISRRENLTAASIIGVITDFEAEPIWVKPEISGYVVATEQVKKQLQNWGASEEKIEVHGIPLNPSFSKKYVTDETRQRFGLDARPIVLLMGGGMGPTKMNEVAGRLLQTGKDLQIIALPAKDSKAKAQLEKLQNSPTVSLQIIGWTSLIAELMQAAQILATKPGGLTLSEAAACGLPSVLFDAIPGPEEENARYFAGQNASVITHGSEETAAEVLRLLDDLTERQKMSANAKKLAHTDTSEQIVNLALTTLARNALNEKIFTPCKRLSAYRKMFSAWRKLEARKNEANRKDLRQQKKKIDGNFKKSISGMPIK